MDTNPGCAVVMPQMGASISEGTITRWLVEVGSRVEKDQPLFEISTDKVDAAIPSPISGVLREIRYPVGATVPVNIVVAWIGPPEERDTELLGARESLQETPSLLPPGDLQEREQKTAANKIRILWIVLALYCGSRLLWRLYSFQQGEIEIDRAVIPGAMLFFSVAQLVTTRRRLLFQVLILMCGVLLLLGILSLLFQ